MEEHMKVPEVALLLLGSTGTGKSTFVSELTGQDDIVGRSLESCTNEANIIFTTHLKGKNVYIVDTPGFDDTNRSDIEVLREIAHSLQDLYDRGILLLGVIYLQRISDPRISGATWKALNILELICGEKAFRNIVLVSTMWDRVWEDATKYEIGDSREKQLCSINNFWGKFIRRGARYTRLRSDPYLELSGDYGKFRHPIEIIMSMIEMPPPESFKIQDELEFGGETPRLEDTSVGRYLEENLHKLREQYEKELNSLKKELDELGEKDMAEYFAGEAQGYKKKLDRTEADLSALRTKLPRRKESLTGQHNVMMDTNCQHKESQVPPKLAPSAPSETKRQSPTGKAPPARPPKSSSILPWGRKG